MQNDLRGLIQAINHNDYKTIINAKVLLFCYTSTEVLIIIMRKNLMLLQSLLETIGGLRLTYSKLEVRSTTIAKQKRLRTTLET